MKISRIVCCLFLTIVGLVAIWLPSPTLAQEEKIELEATYPRIESATPGASFKFSITLKYQGNQARTFDLQALGPSGWTTFITSNDESVRIAAIKLEPNKYRPDQVKVMTTPPASTTPELKEYKITLVASSGALTGNIELTAVVTPTYSLDLVLSSRGYYPRATAGKDNFFSMYVRNTGSGALTNIIFSADKPGGWLIEFSPEKIDSLTPGSSEKIEVNIKPTAKSSAEEYQVTYQVTLIAAAEQTRKTTDVMVLVEEAKGFWMWVGAGIAILVIAGFTAIFLRFGRHK